MKDNVLVKKFNKENVLTIMLVLFLVLWRVPFLNKGIDYTDTGFSMENYKNMFLGEGIRGIGRFYTVVLGGFLYKLLPAYHLLVYRVLHWILNLITYFFSYKIFKKHLNKNLILIGLIAVSFSAKSGEALFSYYPLTGCLLLLSVWLLISGVKEKSAVKILISGFVSGLNVFVRLPNLLFLSMVVALLIYMLQSGEGVKKTFRFTIWYIAGALVSLLTSLLVMVAVLGVDGVINSFMGYVRLALGQTTPGIENFLGIDETSQHSLFANVWTVAIQVWKSVKSLVILVPVVFVGFLTDKLTKNNISRIVKVVVYCIVFVLTGSILSNSILHTLYLAAILSGMIVIFRLGKESAELVFLNVVAILMSGCAIFGSDAGLTRMNIVSTMLVLALILNTNKLKFVLAKEGSNFKCNMACILVNTKTVIIVAVILVSLFNLVPKTYNDAEFLELSYSVNSEIKALKGMKTSRIRAEQINEYYSVMSKAELRDKEVAIFGYFPLGIVIGNQKDYFEQVQPCIDYPGVSVKKLLKNIQTKDAQGVKPVIVVSYVHQLQNNRESFTSDAKQAVLNYMLSLYEYEKCSDSEYFTIYKPTE